MRYPILSITARTACDWVDPRLVRQWSGFGFSRVGRCHVDPDTPPKDVHIFQRSFASTKSSPARLPDHERPHPTPSLSHRRWLPATSVQVLDGQTIGEDFHRSAPACLLADIV